MNGDHPRFGFRLLITIGVALIVINPVTADFQWSASWQATPQGTGSSAFTPGTDTPDGGSFTGSASASVSINSNNLYVGHAQAGSVITRPFTLSGSPSGWRVSVSTFVNGSVSGLHATGSISYTSMVNNTTLFSSGINNGGGGMTFPYSYGTPFPPSVVLADGTHTFTLSNLLGTSFPGPPFSGPGSFAGAMDSYSVQITVTSLTPVPEPQAAMSLLPFGLAFSGLMIPTLRR